MNQQIKHKIIATLASFIGLGIFILLLVIGIVFFSYLLLIGGIIGLILFCFFYLRAKFFLHKMKKQTKQTEQKPSAGRTIDHDQQDSPERHDR